MCYSQFISGSEKSGKSNKNLCNIAQLMLITFRFWLDRSTDTLITSADVGKQIVWRHSFQMLLYSTLSKNSGRVGRGRMIKETLPILYTSQISLAGRKTAFTKINHNNNSQPPSDRQIRFFHNGVSVHRELQDLLGGKSSFVGRR